jgi:Peptidase propeptide and YPEB domain
MRKRALIVGAALVVAGALVGGAIAVAGSDGEGNVTGPQADRAVKAALEATGGGTAQAVELDNEAGATWEVEVTTPEGNTVDVRLDENFKLVVIDGDTETRDTDDSSD